MTAAVVTGGANGIGKAVVERLVRSGHDVAVLDVEPGTPIDPAVEAAAGEGARAHFVPCDVTDERQVRRSLESVAADIGPFAAVVHCAGQNTVGDSIETTADQFDAGMAVNLRAAWLVAKHAAPHMLAAGGSIVLIASVHAFQTRAARFPYAVAKAGILGLTRTLALDLGPRNIRVNAICPGFVRTRLLEAGLSGVDDRAATLARIEGTHPLGRIGEPEDIAGVAHFLATADAAFITGTSIVVDGGLTATLPG